MTLHDNLAARALLQHLDFHPESSRGHESEFALDLTHGCARSKSTTPR
jgi:hypothetical protein